MKNRESRIRVTLLALAIFSVGIASAATVSWTNTSGGNWSVPENWDANQPPGAADTAIITNDGTYTVILDVNASIGSLTLGGASGKQTLTKSGATLTLNNSGVINGNGIFSQSGGTLNGNSGLTVLGQMHWTGGDIFNPLVVLSNAVVNLTGSNNKNLYAPLTNSGTVNWSGTGNMQVYDAGANPYHGKVFNLAGGAFNILNDRTMTGGGGLGFFNNAGTLQKSSGIGTASISLFFTNTGTVNVESGDLNFTEGGSMAGNFTTAAGATINLTGGSFSCEPSVVFDGHGTSRMTGGQITFIDGLPPGFQLLGGTAAMVLTPSFQGGSITNLTLNSFATLIGDYTVSGIFNCAGGASGNLLVAGGGTFNWTGGPIVGAVTVASNAVLNLTGSNYKPLYAPLTNAGTIIWSGSGNVQVYNTAADPYRGRIANLPGALLHIQNDQQMYSSGSSGFLDNAGTVRKSAGSGSTYFDLACANSGTVSAETGTINFLGAYSSTASASFSVSLGGVLPGTDYGHIQFTNALAAVGTFTVGTRNGFRPNPGDTFQVLSYLSATNEFACINGLDLGGGVLLLPQFGLASLTLTAGTYHTNNVLPELFLARAPAGLSVTWPFGFPGWILQSTTNLSTLVWEPVPVQCNNQAVVPIFGPQQYFRLKR